MTLRPVAAAAVLAGLLGASLPALAAGCPGLPPVGGVAEQDGRRAWLAAPRDSYRHGVFGEPREPGALVLQGAAAGPDGLDCQVVVLPQDRVFEDRQPRFWDADGDGAAELVLVEAQLDSGARLVVYGLGDGVPAPAAEAAPLGFHRWLSPAGVVPWDKAGGPLLAVVTTPHIGGVLRLYRYRPGTARLEEVAQLAGWSTHRFGSGLPSTALVDRTAGGDAWIVLPDRARRSLSRVRWREGAWQVQALGGLEAEIAGAIAVAPDGCHYVVPAASATLSVPRPPFPGEAAPGEVPRAGCPAVP